MTISKNDLENLYHITGEIRDIEDQLLKVSNRSKEYVGDTYKDYSDNAKGTIKIIRGYGMNENTFNRQQILYDKLRLKRNKLIEMKMNMEYELEVVEDVIIRRIIRLRFYDRFTWESVAIAIDSTKSGEAMRKRMERFLDGTG